VVFVYEMQETPLAHFRSGRSSPAMAYAVTLALAFQCSKPAYLRSSQQYSRPRERVALLRLSSPSCLSLLLRSSVQLRLVEAQLAGHVEGPPHRSMRKRLRSRA